MANADSTVEQNTDGQYKNYDAYVVDFYYRLNQVKGLIAGANALNNEENQDIDSLLYNALEEIKKMANELYATADVYQIKGVSRHG